ncbi:NADP-dependent oxidoreductase [Cryptosporangium aurantiacum]|uniref:NADPH:quinone reductase n=1 Tax=Cryptosporangium aurantiacum TaxID=134849 RepID=A0A1M7R3M3_9ACTN|nr:NADP-dependent oxidoreductase [Cryptosporangium aurantiacum]SHN39490.1 NADPH:quinone reductase [Cryptosporangium aurantiacum]
MKAIGFTRHGAPEVLETLELPDPTAGAGEVRIRVRAASVNPVDAIIRLGLFDGMVADDRHPLVTGMDVAGTIDAIGPDQPDGFDLAVGDAVIGFVVPSGSHGGYSEYIVLPSLSVTRMPSNVDFVAGASFLSNALTAELTLEALALPSGSTLAVTGAAGAVGGYLVELGAARGLVVIADAAADDEKLVRGLGATHVVRRGAEFVGDVLDVTDGRGADALGDGAILTDAVLPAVRDGGQIAFYLPTDVRPDRGITPFHSYVMRSATRHDAIERLARMVERGELTTRVAEVYPADDAVAAHQRLEQGKLRGRQILTF